VYEATSRMHANLMRCGLGVLCSLGFLLLLTITGSVEATSNGPLRIRSQNPLYLQLLAMPMEAPPTLQHGQIEAILHTTFSNVFEVAIPDQPPPDLDPDQLPLDLDMEIWRTAVILGYGVTSNFDVTIELPFISNGGGFLDSFVQHYHEAFGFPNGGRDLVEDNRFRYRLMQHGVTRFDYDSQRFGLSDIVLRGKIFIPGTKIFPLHLAIAPYVKFPTGRQSQGLSSGRTDIGLALLAQTSWQQVYLTTQVGVVILGGHAAIGDLIRTAFVSFGLSAEYKFFNALSAIVQLTGNSPAFEPVQDTELSDMILDLSVGVAGTVELRRNSKTKFFYQATFSEDVLGSGPSVDFSVLFLVGIRL
jgi:hypothetical protein